MGRQALDAAGDSGIASSIGVAGGASLLGGGDVALGSAVRRNPELGASLIGGVLERLRDFLNEPRHAPLREAAELAYWSELPANLEAKSLGEYKREEDVRWEFAAFATLDFQPPSELRVVEAMAEQSGGQGRFAEVFAGLVESRMVVARSLGPVRQGMPRFEVLIPEGAGQIAVEGFGRPDQLEVGELMAMRIASIGGRELLLLDPQPLRPMAVRQIARELAEAPAAEVRALLPRLVIGQVLADAISRTKRYCEARRGIEPPKKPEQALVLSSLLTPLGGLKFPLHPTDLRTAFYEGRLAMRGTQAGSKHEPLPGLLACRRRPRKQACGGRLTATVECSAARDDDVGPLVRWFCPECGDRGNLGRWQGSAFDAQLDADFWSAAAPERRRSLILSHTDLRHLERRARLGPLGLGLLLRAQDSPWVPDLWNLEGPAAAFLELARGYLAGLSDKPLGAPSKAQLKLAGELCRAAGISTELGRTRRNAERLIDEARRAVAAPIAGPTRGDLELEITLEHTDPPIQRRLVLPADRSLHDLHVALQIAMGWTDFHAFEIQRGERRFAIPPKHASHDLCDTCNARDALATSEASDAHETAVGELFEQPGDECRYRYDLDNDWDHRIVLVKQLDSKGEARLLSGTRACPPEDCGGPEDYAELIEVIQQPFHPRYTETTKRIEPDFDPKAFDLEAHAERLERLGLAWQAPSPAPLREPATRSRAKPHDRMARLADPKSE